MGNHARLGVDQKDKDLTYDIWNKCKTVGIVGTIPRESVRNRKEGIFVSYQFFTVTLPYFSYLYSIWYKKYNIKILKIIPVNIEELLTPIAIAY